MESNVRAYFKTINVLKYKELSEGEVYNLVHINGFKLVIALVKLNRKGRNELELEDVKSKSLLVFYKKEYKKEWLLNKQM